MYQFDLRSSSVLPGIALALLGLLWLLTRPARVAALLAAWVVPFLFAYTYNVGDTHVFFLPSHQIVVLRARAASRRSWLLRASRRPSAAGGVLSVTAASSSRIRSGGHGTRGLPSIGTRISGRWTWLSAVAVASASPTSCSPTSTGNSRTASTTTGRRLHPELNMVRATDTILTLSILVHNNIADGRNVYATPIARELALAAYGDVFAFTRRSGRRSRPLAATARELAPGTPYVLAVLRRTPIWCSTSRSWRTPAAYSRATRPRWGVSRLTR